MEAALLLLAFFGLMTVIPIIKWMWPTADDDSSVPQLLGSARVVTTSQIARGVFWGLWLFVLSQAVISLVIFVAVITFIGPRT